MTTEQWIRRIDMIREAEGIDSSRGDAWRTFETPISQVAPRRALPIGIIRMPPGLGARAQWIGRKAS
jgi:hypothetical protein